MVVRSNRRAAGAQTAEEVHAGSDRKVSEHTGQRSLLCMGAAVLAAKGGPTHYDH